MPTPLSCLSFLSVFLSFVSFNNDSFLLEQWFSFSFSFLFLLPCEGQSLSGPLFPPFPPALLNLSCLFSPLCVLCNTVGEKNLFQICGFSFIISPLSNKGKKCSEVCQTQWCERTHQKKTSVLKGVRGFSSQNNWSGRLYSNTVRKYKKGGTICVNHSGS